MITSYKKPVYVSIVNELAMCHECEAGIPGLVWEDFSERPAWEATMFATRPFQGSPPLSVIPIDDSAPERLFRKDPFHIGKVGILRDMCGSTLFWLVENQYYGSAGNLPSKLEAAHGAFKLFCSTTGQQPSLRSFTKSLFVYTSRKTFPWANTKGSDTMLLLKFLVVQVGGFLFDPLRNSDVEMLELMKKTLHAAINYYDVLYGHSLFLTRSCALNLYIEGSRFIAGYNLLANKCLGSWSLYAVKPKLHLWKHCLVEIRQLLEKGVDLILSPLAFNCEPNEDAIGQMSRLSRRLDSRGVEGRALQCFLVQADMAYRRHREQ